MKYVIKSRTLYQEGSNIALAKIDRSFIGTEKTISKKDSNGLWKTSVQYLGSEKSGDVREKEYVMKDQNDCVVASARPGYTSNEDPAINGWPICHMPKVDHAELMIDEEPYRLEMQSSQKYVLVTPVGGLVWTMTHGGLTGGWVMETEAEMRPELLCAIYCFCRYIELENEFMIV